MVSPQNFNYDIFLGPHIFHIKFRENRPSGFRDIAVLVVRWKGKQTKKGKKKEKMAVAICPIFSENVHFLKVFLVYNFFNENRHRTKP